MKINVADAAYTLIPRKQEPRSQPMAVSRTITNVDLERMTEKGVAKSVISKLSQQLLTELTGYLRESLVNAGPHVIDVKLTVAYDAQEERHLIIASTPCIPSKTYGAEVKSEDLVVMPRLETEEKPLSSGRTTWSLLMGWLDKDIKYDGPRGERDI